MSRVDQALRRLEARAVEPAEEPRPADRTSGLSQYGREGPSDTGPVAPLPALDAERIVSVAPSRAFRPTVDGDLEARLVTGRLSAVSLEQYRRLAAVLHEAQATRGLKSVMITSALPNEGKTLTTVNLALTMSEAYARRVLVIDADLRWPSIHRYLGLENRRGLTEGLRDERSDLAFVQASDRLAVLTAGQPGPTPLAGLSSPRMASLLEECTSRFDWVLLDTPPVGLLPDAQLLARQIGGVILVIGAGSAPATTVERAVAELGTDCIIGTVLNRVENHRVVDAGYYDRYNTAERE